MTDKKRRTGNSIAFGQTLRALREERKLGQEQLGEMCGGLAQAYIAQLESGVREPSLATSRKLAKALKVKWEALFNGGSK